MKIQQKFISQNYYVSTLQPIEEKPHFGKEKAEGKFCAVAQQVGEMKRMEFAEKVSHMSRGYDEYTVYGVMKAMAKCLRKQLLEDCRMEVGPLGNFYTVINSEGSTKVKNYARNSIKDVKVNWSPSKQFKSLTNDAKFQRVIPRKAQFRVKAAILRAIKENDAKK